MKKILRFSMWCIIAFAVLSGAVIIGTIISAIIYPI